MERNGVKAPTNGQMSQSTPETGSTTILKEKANTSGPMAEFTMVNGKRISFMAKVFTHGQMEGDMKVNTKMIKSTVWAATTGQMEKLTKDNGSTESNMEKPGSPIQRDVASLDFGKMESVSSGSMPRVQ